MAEIESARAAAADLVAAVTGEGMLLSELLNAGPISRLGPADRARAQRLAVETLRQCPRADHVLKPFLRRMPPERVRAVLRVATVEMLGLGAPVHAVVAGAVEAMHAGGRKTEGFSGLVNAVLRKVAAISPEDWAALPVPELPGWLRGRLMSAWGKAAVQRMEAAHLAAAPLDITPRGADAAELAALLDGTVLPGGSVRLQGKGQVSGLPGFAEGRWWVQDAAAAVPARLLAVTPGMRVADLCAAPGGKTLQLAAAGAAVTAVDLSEARLARLSENLARTGLSAEVICADALEWRPDAPLDAVLLDAPCSATGTIRRHPDLPLAKSAQGLKPLFALQAELLDHAAGLLRPGGQLIFCTCSLLPDEGERQVAAFLERHPEMQPDPDATRADWIEEDWRAGPGALRLRPDFWADQGGMDGFYIACLRREQ